MTTDNKTLADVQPGGRVRLGDAPHYWPEVDRIRVDAYVAGSEGDEFDMIAARNAIHAALAARQPVGISADWVLGYLTTDAPEESREAIRNAFAEYAALSGARQPVGEPVGYACTNCDRTDEVVICQTCAGMAWDNGRLHEFHEVRELSTSLGEGVLDHLLPDEWHEKPLLRFQGAFDEGDDSVGISPRSANVLADDQTGTVLGDYLAARAAKEGAQ
ncbi:hypothetical protein I5W36_15030 [Stenotrophomonas maltophilia]|uniref:zf-UBR domain-containing protein n=1 Tax=Stenotrophomonas sp. 232 TaxID=2785387 RepID=UPI000259B6F1|nr:zf-UBR domain-containing protein [Stenotrophomonas sp. 232]KKF88625.1 hypothetical protein XY58_08390 [Stenotrophomonas maltophilia]CCH12145.1 hypothetical protein SMD_1593 [Stenotrophomonas maltophilia D457]MBA0453664.1 hypothetical protein [Stenotrophomonas maltophilia]MBF9138334.1 hypothetical protein [Stenotrophomonas sp. 232]MBH1517616.1 hypothetical protein [Stenotrophomonas maltophilia]